MAKKLNAFEIKLLLEYRQYQDIKNLADKNWYETSKRDLNAEKDRNSR